MPLPLINLILLAIFLYLISNMRYINAYGVLPVLVAVTVNLIAELATFYINLHENKNGNFYIYNFSLPVELISYGLLYKKLFRHTGFVHIINISFFLIPALTVLSFIVHKSIFSFTTVVAVYGSVFLLVTTLYFFIQLFRFDYFYENPLKQFFFWVSVGLLLCYIGSLTYLSNVNHLAGNPWLKELLRSLNFILNCVLYACIFISVKCLKLFPDSQIQSF